MPNFKIAKISSDISRAISEILFDEARDEILKSVTITGCKVSRDLSYAKVYFTSLSNIDKNILVKEVNEAAPFIRGELANKIDIRHTPILEFIYDDSIEYASRIESIIKDMKEEK
ncbi:MAG: 30S ribosome-binding factor RbfA [Firmicutes bacterium]|nr:30S ribosome-binding factor RbfA [Bacillota bacterium]